MREVRELVRNKRCDRANTQGGKPAAARPRSLITQGGYRIHAGGLSRRPEAGKKSSREEQDRYRREGIGVKNGYVLNQPGKHTYRRQAAYQAEQNARTD